ncbi:MAG TPA: YqhA family protein [Casimicrobiaceae bacterium]|nr:YqhA family protein [Casimicrobiaceae bacterium]
MKRDSNSNRGREGGKASGQADPPDAQSQLGQIVGHSRYVVLIAVAAVLLVAVSLFVLGSVRAIVTVWHAWINTFSSGGPTPRLSVEFLEIVIVMLEAVVFFLIGVGLFSLFISPLNLAIALGVESINDLEERVIGVVVAVLAVTFLQHFIQSKEPLQTLQLGAALAATVASLVLFQRYSHRAKEDHKANQPDTLERSKRAMFEEEEETHSMRNDKSAK